ncbi:MAG TPA: formate dehydrogenase subunit delta [Mesorhizobium sp.]|jgi:formate dehydrogenase subunit delta|nr:formate dehydrogenase subunit delta [Mesorhizobium sp.]
MSHEETGRLGGDQKLVVMANQIAAFFESQPREEAQAGVAKHINDFWEPRMRRKFFAIVDAGGAGLKPLVIAAAAQVRRPAVETPAG